MKALELVIKCPECGNIGIKHHYDDQVSKNRQQQVRCDHYKCGKYFNRTHPEFILQALTEKVSELEKTVNILLSWKENLLNDLQSINKDIAKLQKESQ